MARKSTTAEIVTTRSSEGDPAVVPDQPQAPRRGRGRPPLNGYVMPDAMRSRAARDRRDDDLRGLISAYYHAVADKPLIPGDPRLDMDRAALRVARRVRPDLADAIATELDRLHGPDTSSDAR